MSAIGAWGDMMPWTVTVAPRSSGNSYSGQSYGTAVSHDAAIQMNIGTQGGDSIVKDATGQEVVFRYRIFLKTTTIPDVLDEVTLPSEFGSVTPEIVNVKPVSDENGIHHVILWVK